MSSESQPQFNFTEHFDPSTYEISLTQNGSSTRNGRREPRELHSDLKPVSRLYSRSSSRNRAYRMSSNNELPGHEDTVIVEALEGAEDEDLNGPFNPEELTKRLERAKLNLQNKNRSPHHHSKSLSDHEFQKRAKDTVHEILERMERHRYDVEPHLFGSENAPGMDNGSHGHNARTRPRFNPDLMRNTSQAMRQSHGNANLRHGQCTSSDEEFG
ncbi:hypothetical protein BGW38_006830 [Lunasporangiospora selenospora]|uniref:Uncharacterized protein n=1 Tax=Lunasporangiospora selenospora TaxID=979761 RepID=A0A9P6FZA3_9FUNG|nr:hypothetical protein BGW38_006830 [Lunasporangiospora selenospora]